MALLAFATFALVPLGVAAKAEKPHVLFILADDYGWGNLGVHRREGVAAVSGRASPEELQGKAEVHTPHIDALIDAGVLLDRHYAYKICSPSRSSIQSGRLAVHVNSVNSPVTSQNYEDPVSGYAGIPRNMTGIAEKLRDAGYRTHRDAGMATPEHSPRGRGYETWYGYYQHANDYWHKSKLGTGEVDACLNHMKDLSMHNATYCGPVRDAISLSAACEMDEESDPGCYEEHLFKERVLEIIQNHNVTSPLFLFYSFHLVHTPLQIPKAWLSKIDEVVKAAGGKAFDDQNRRLYSAMVLYMDAAVGAAVEALKQKNMYDNTLIIFTSDNGGPIYEPGSASNYPLRGSKTNDWEGGIRTNAFVSGGFVPVHRRGQKFEGIINVADWYGTLTELAGVDMRDLKAEAANVWLKEKGLPLLHPVDSVPQWQNIINDQNGRKDAMHLSSQALFMWPYKLVTGKQPLTAWLGPLYPNCSTVKSRAKLQGPQPPAPDSIFGQFTPWSGTGQEVAQQTWSFDCEAGCLMNVRDDPTEHKDLAKDPKYAAILTQMQETPGERRYVFWKGFVRWGGEEETLKKMNQELFTPDRGIDRVEACDVAIEQDRTFGPFVDVEGFYSPNPKSKDLAQNFEDQMLSATLHALNESELKSFFVASLKKEVPKALQKGSADKCLKKDVSLP
ncbi:Arylsulfatase B (ASB) (N-acetylgalactosamine-4-sulfatase) (G4S) [Durusdinium trenchii]|uniref:Arylsulfatase B (ASB) (N-acetylgalactosamine-4-sulfatase) (G4S) n=1 Tax=Durusdinium trenchii TaxID=1381693 RepID=A0ABP0NMN0_9DINO